MTVIDKKVHFGRGKRSEKVLRQGPEPVRGRVPRISKLMALAITFEELMRSGAVRTFAELAELGHVSPARITQIMNLLLLAPAIQERLLFLPAVEMGRDPVLLRDLQAVAREAGWGRPWSKTTRRLPIQIARDKLELGIAKSRGVGLTAKAEASAPPCGQAP